MSMGTKIKVSVAILVAAACVYFVVRTPRTESPRTESPRTESPRMAAVEPLAADEQLVDAAVVSVFEHPTAEIGPRTSFRIG